MNSLGVFGCSGFPSRLSLNDERWKELFNQLESDQSQFLSQEKTFRSPEYRWPRDPLHCWSRVWEYPFVFEHIRRIVSEHREEQRLQVLDVGSGVTFFPFSTARLGCNVTCVDIDPICLRDIPLAAAAIDTHPGTVDAKLISDNRIPVLDASQDVVYCVSVLEHIDDTRPILDEIRRVLRLGGKFILTLDVDLRGNAELGPKAYYELQRELSCYFVPVLPEASTHPRDILTTINSPYPLRKTSIVTRCKTIIKKIAHQDVFFGHSAHDVFLTVYGTVLQKTN